MGGVSPWVITPKSGDAMHGWLQQNIAYNTHNFGLKMCV